MYLIPGSAVIAFRSCRVDNFGVKGPNAEGDERERYRHNPVHPEVIPAVGFDVRVKIGQSEEGLSSGSARQQTVLDEIEGAKGGLYRSKGTRQKEHGYDSDGRHGSAVSLRLLGDALLVLGELDVDPRVVLTKDVEDTHQKKIGRSQPGARIVVGAIEVAHELCGLLVYVGAETAHLGGVSESGGQVPLVLGLDEAGKFG